MTCVCACAHVGLGAEGPTQGRVRKEVRVGAAALSWVLATLYVTHVRTTVTCPCSVRAGGSVCEGTWGELRA